MTTPTNPFAARYLACNSGCVTSITTHHHKNGSQKRISALLFQSFKHGLSIFFTLGVFPVTRRAVEIRLAGIANFQLIEVGSGNPEGGGGCIDASGVEGVKEWGVRCWVWYEPWQITMAKLGMGVAVFAQIRTRKEIGTRFGSKR